MSDHLPDDPTRWPDAPHEVLAVPPSIGRKDLRVAYVRLIRQYKPDLFPEQFRRIRAAYESMLQFLDWNEQLPQDQLTNPSSDGTGDSAPVGGSGQYSRNDAASDHPTADPRHTGTFGSTLPDELDRIWEQACDGHTAEAYAALIQLDEQHPQHETVCLRGYWLLRTDPRLDPQREPCDWLARGLRAGRGPLLELYRREIEENPAEAFGRRYGELANAETSLPQLVALTELRWLAAAREQRWSLIKEDLAILRPQMREAPESWARLLYEACGHLAWEQTDEPSAMFLICRREIDQMYDPLQSWSGALDRLDFLVELTAEWRRLYTLGEVPEVCATMPVCWSRPGWEIKAELEPLIARIARNPEAGLTLLDFLGQQSPKVLAQLATSLSDLARWEGVDTATESELHASILNEFLTECAGTTTYEGLRPHILNFCLLEEIMPYQFATAAHEYPLQTISTDGRNLAEWLFQDESIHLSYVAYQLFWT